jgi:hypothetical protein
MCHIVTGEGAGSEHHQKAAIQFDQSLYSFQPEARQAIRDPLTRRVQKVDKGCDAAGNGSYFAE